MAPFVPYANHLLRTDGLALGRTESQNLFHVIVSKLKYFTIYNSD
jgi:hypothetical protein